jgi:aspartate/methionine/tyrosine aminotransferase
VVLLLVAALAGDWISGGYERARATVERNRTIVRETLQEVGLNLADPTSQISVARIELPVGGPDSSLLYKDMVAKGVHVLPCAPFHWADPPSGQRFIRVSLARPVHAVETAARTLAQSYLELSGAG